MENREEIISIVDATVAAYSNSPVWYKTDIMRYMKRYSDQQNKALLEEIERLKEANQQQESDIKRFKSIQSQETTRANELQDEVERLKSELKAAESGNQKIDNDYKQLLKRYHNTRAQF